MIYLGGRIKKSTGGENYSEVFGLSCLVNDERKPVGSAGFSSSFGISQSGYAK